MRHAVIMAGGSGTRFWPFSRKHNPKQFLALYSDMTFLQETIHRVSPLIPQKNIWIVSNIDHKDIVAEQLQDYPYANVLFEPTAKNTAPCIAWAAVEIQKVDPHANIVVLPSDHWVDSQDKFVSCLEKGLEFTKENKSIVTIGIPPKTSHTGYGYIEVEENGAEVPDSELPIRNVLAFHEKPDKETAEKYVKSGNFHWNAGIFIVTVPTLLSLYKTHLPDQYYTIQKLMNTNEDDLDGIKQIYNEFSSISFDHGIMEKAADVTSLIPANFEWNDIGSWTALKSMMPKDDFSNAINSSATLENSSGNLILVKNKHVSLIDVDNLIIVDTDDALLVCPKSSDQKVKNIVQKLPDELK